MEISGKAAPRTSDRSVALNTSVYKKSHSAREDDPSSILPAPFPASTISRLKHLRETRDAPSAAPSTVSPRGAPRRPNVPRPPAADDGKGSHHFPELNSLEYDPLTPLDVAAAVTSADVAKTLRLPKGPTERNTMRHTDGRLAMSTGKRFIRSRSEEFAPRRTHDDIRASIQTMKRTHESPHPYVDDDASIDNASPRDAVAEDEIGQDLGGNGIQSVAEAFDPQSNLPTDDIHPDNSVHQQVKLKDDQSPLSEPKRESLQSPVQHEVKKTTGTSLGVSLPDDLKTFEVAPTITIVDTNNQVSPTNNSSTIEESTKAAVLQTSPNTIILSLPKPNHQNSKATGPHNPPIFAESKPANLRVSVDAEKSRTPQPQPQPPGESHTIVITKPSRSVSMEYSDIKLKDKATAPLQKARTQEVDKDVARDRTEKQTRKKRAVSKDRHDGDIHTKSTSNGIHAAQSIQVNANPLTSPMMTATPSAAIAATSNVAVTAPAPTERKRANTDAKIRREKIEVARQMEHPTSNAIKSPRIVTSSNNQEITPLAKTSYAVVSTNPDEHTEIQRSAAVAEVVEAKPDHGLNSDGYYEYRQKPGPVPFASHGLAPEDCAPTAELSISVLRQSLQKGLPTPSADEKMSSTVSVHATTEAESAPTLPSVTFPETDLSIQQLVSENLYVGNHQEDLPPSPTKVSGPQPTDKKHPPYIRTDMSEKFQDATSPASAVSTDPSNTFEAGAIPSPDPFSPAAASLSDFFNLCVGESTSSLPSDELSKEFPVDYMRVANLKSGNSTPYHSADACSVSCMSESSNLVAAYFDLTPLTLSVDDINIQAGTPMPYKPMQTSDSPERESEQSHSVSEIPDESGDGTLSTNRSGFLPPIHIRKPLAPLRSHGRRIPNGRKTGVRSSLSGELAGKIIMAKGVILPPIKAPVQANAVPPMQISGTSILKSTSNTELSSMKDISSPRLVDENSEYARPPSPPVTSVGDLGLKDEKDLTSKMTKYPSGLSAKEQSKSLLLLDDSKENDLMNVGAASTGTHEASSELGGGTFIDLLTAADLRILAFGNCKETIPPCWRHGIYFSEPNKPIGLKQMEPGPCGVIAAVQAYFIKNIKSFAADQSMDARLTALSCSISEIVWQSRPSCEEARAVFCLKGEPRSFGLFPPNYEPDGFTENLNIYYLCSEVDLMKFVRSHINQLMQENDMGIMLVLYSLMLTRGAGNIKSDMDLAESYLIGNHHTCSQELVNLLLVGYASSNSFDGIHRIDGMELKGIKERAKIGFLSGFEFYGYCQVGSLYKEPIHPVWIVASGLHFSVLFSEDGDHNKSQLFELVHYDPLDHTKGFVRVQIDPSKSMPKKEEDSQSCYLTLDACIYTKWPYGIHFSGNSKAELDP